ncbi:MAG TPA: hypothetical protein VL098_04835 [Flavipsychrobacter sp.]|nr:hypothetical protein [Flavipsychrobacter sp.]
METTLIPENEQGKQNDIVFSRTLPTREAAIQCFKRACKRVINPQIWHELTGMLSPEVKLYTEAGEVHRLAAVKDFFRLDIPGPGTLLGGGYDWVQVAAIEDQEAEDADEAIFAMKLHPAADPQSDSSDAAHFFNAAASSTFVVHRLGNTVTASYHGRNELPNNKTRNTIDNLRNTVVAAGAAIGLSELQWKALIKNFLQEEIGA